jgi:hypothetical protein
MVRVKQIWLSNNFLHQLAAWPAALWMGGVLVGTNTEVMA